MASELQENILHLKEKQERENQNTIRRRQTIVNGRRNEEKMWNISFPKQTSLFCFFFF
jgi:hypothetical protein